jgi:methylated-DNA-protein-cysteine methyltransferase-like protein
MAALPAHTTVPWHRVINAQGRVSIRAGGDPRLEQRFLLEAEGVVFGANGRVPLERFGWRGTRRRKEE